MTQVHKNYDNLRDENLRPNTFALAATIRLSRYCLFVHEQIAYLHLYQSLHIFRYTFYSYTSVMHIHYAKLVTHFIRRPLRSYTITHFIPDPALEVCTSPVLYLVWQCYTYSQYKVQNHASQKMG